MIRWNNDYNQIAHPAVMKALMETQENAYPGYGADEWCEKAAGLIRGLTKCPNAFVNFFPGATQANFIVIAAALTRIESVICANTGHIYAHEAGSIENTDHKLLPLQHRNGKITAEQIEAEASAYYDHGEAEYLTRPKMVYISFATEWGTIYSLKEMEDISAVCRKYDMYLFVDGARLGYGLSAADCDVTLEDMARLCDVFYIGGTKCGAMFGEAVIITNDKLKRGFRTYMKQSGAVMAKSWLMGFQFYELLKDGLYFEITARADRYAMEIRDAFHAKGIEMYVENTTNQQFPVLTVDQAEKLAEEHIYEVQWTKDGKCCVRFCTSWATKRENVDRLISDIRKL